MSDLVQRLMEQPQLETIKDARKANAYLTALCQEAAEELTEANRKLAEMGTGNRAYWYDKFKVEQEKAK